MAEREGFDYRHFLQVAVKPRHSDNTLCLCGVQAHFQLWVCCLGRLPMTSIDHENGITSITLETWRIQVSPRAFVHIVNSSDR
jgi:hypothetical protein